MAQRRLFSYVVARDYGFAPNPFFGFCTLATCKPRIRQTARPGDWVVGTGSSARQRKGYIVYAMRVTEAMTFNAYWADPRFVRKKPNLNSSKKLAFGDNIYRRDTNGHWHQENSHHSCADGTVNHSNLKNDTQADRVLVSADFAYWGGSGPTIPDRFRDFLGMDICAIRNHKSRFPEALVEDFVTWFRSLHQSGYISAPLDWDRTQ